MAWCLCAYRAFSPLPAAASSHVMPVMSLTRWFLISLFPARSVASSSFACQTRMTLRSHAWPCATPRSAKGVPTAPVNGPNKPVKGPKKAPVNGPNKPVNGPNKRQQTDPNLHQQRDPNKRTEQAPETGPNSASKRTKQAPVTGPNKPVNGPNKRQ